MQHSQTPRPDPSIFEKACHSRKVHSETRCQFKSVQPPRLIKWHAKENLLLSSQNAVNISFSKKHELSPLYKANETFLYVDQCFDIIEKIGEGSFGEVFKVKSKEDNKYYAVKKSKERFRNLTDKKNKLEEVRKHELIPKHPYCLRLYRAWEQREHLYIQLELCEMTLAEYSSMNHCIEEEKLWEILLDLLLAVKNLHDKHLVHLDIKLDNVLMSKDSKCKLADFGLVFDLVKGNTDDAMEGDPKYLAPELMQGNFSKAADIFSIGIAILELAYDIDLPSNGNLWHELRSENIPEFTHRVISSELLSVIHRMMHVDYTKRPTVDELLKYPKLAKMVFSRKISRIFDLAKNMLEFVSYLKYIPFGIVNVPIYLCRYVKSVVGNMIWSNMITEIELNTSKVNTPTDKHSLLKRSSSFMYLKELELDLLDSSGASDPEEEKDLLSKVEITPDKEVVKRLFSQRKRSGLGKRPRNLMEDFKNVVT